MITYIMIVLLFIFSFMKFYKSRTLFKKLSKKEWLQYITVFLFAWAVAATIILGGAKLTNTIDVGWIRMFLGIIIILIGLTVAGFISEKLLPEKLKAFYN